MVKDEEDEGREEEDEVLFRPRHRSTSGPRAVGKVQDGEVELCCEDGGIGGTRDVWANGQTRVVTHVRVYVCVVFPLFLTCSARCRPLALSS